MREQRIYDLKRWKILRINYLASNPICEMCGVGFASEVDHIKPIKLGGDPWDIHNLQALCHRCHSSKTAAQDHGFGNTSRRTAHPKGCDVYGSPLDLSSEWRTKHETEQLAKQDTQRGFGSA